VKFTPRVIYRVPNRAKPNKFVVDDLPFPHPRAAYNAKWQRVFRPTLLSWASTYSDPYATNTQLEDTVVMEMWDIIYPEIELDRVERVDTALKLVFLVRLTTCYLWRKRYIVTYIYRPETFFMTGAPPSGRVR
jgi:hypothetical protein